MKKEKPKRLFERRDEAVVRAELEQRFRKNPTTYAQYNRLPEAWKERLIAFMAGKKTLPLTYDSVFKRVFDCEVHPERLSRFLSAILGTEVEVLSVLSLEDRLLEIDSLIVMDIVVRFSDGSVANVEIQKIPYAFAGERMSCYSADLLLRQYTKVKSERGKLFTYSDIKKVYTIILFEDSNEMFDSEKYDGAYFHHGRTVFDTGLPLELLQEYFLIALDEFRKSSYSKEKEERTAWLSMLCASDMDEVERLVEEYPWLEEIYRELAEYLVKPEEVMSMFSEALRILDSNTVQYMVDEMKKEVEEKREEVAELKKQLKEETEAQRQEIKEQQHALKQKDARIAELERKLAETTKSE